MPTEMDAFLAWFNNLRSIDPVLGAALAHLWFVTIHPLEDGNGRIARIIAEIALACSRVAPPRERLSHILANEAKKRPVLNRPRLCKNGFLARVDCVLRRVSIRLGSPGSAA